MDISSISWDKRELKSLGFQAGGAVTYVYNSEGIRTQKVVYSSQSADPHVVGYLLDGTKILSETHTTADGSYTLDFIYDESGSVTGFKHNGATYFYQKNIQGDIIRIVSVIGVTFVEYTYDAWGNILSITGDQADTLGQLNPFRYRSYYYDSETGFYYLNSRYYDPEVKRFINADGIVGANGGLQGYNLFAYCNNNPVIYNDPSGEFVRRNTVAINDGGSAVYWPWEYEIQESILTTLGKAVDETLNNAKESVIETANALAEDIENFDSENIDEQKVYESNYFSSYNGKLVIRHESEMLTSWAICQTIFLNHNLDDNSNEYKSNTLKHEYGHTLQENDYGLGGYIVLVGLPSVVLNVVSRYDEEVSENYYLFPWELGADIRGGVVRE